MSGVSFVEIMLLAAIALIVIGPQKLPKIARAVGRLTRQARNAWQGIQSELQAELDADHNRKVMQQAAENKAHTDPETKKPDERAGSD